jgi:hypothetical protein
LYVSIKLIPLILTTLIMATFIKAGFWEQLCKPCTGYKGWLNLDKLIKDIAGEGTVGPQGPQGPQGVEGPQGIQGDTGPQGTAGNSVTILGSYADYAAFLAGAGSMPGANVGDAWILLSDGSLMSWNGTNWFDAGDIKGPPGDQGPQGIQGPQGEQGIQGIQGVPGTSGSNGLFAQTALGTIITPILGETSLIGTGVGSLSVPANAFQVGDSFTAKICGYLSCANNEDIHIRVKSDGNVIADAGVFRLNIATNKYFEIALDFTITKIGGLGVAELFTNGQFSYNKNANSNIDGTNFALVDSTAFDTTILNTLSVTAEWITSNVANKIQSQNSVLTRVY